MSLSEIHELGVRNRTQEGTLGDNYLYLPGNTCGWMPSCMPVSFFTFSHHLRRHDLDRRASLGVDRLVQVPPSGLALHLRAWAAASRPDPEIRWACRLANRHYLALARHDRAAHVGRGGSRYPVSDSA